VSKIRLTFNGAMDPKTVTPTNIRVTGPTGLAVRALSVRQLPVAGTVFEVTIAPQTLSGTGGIRVWVSPAVQSLWPKPLDQDNDGAPGETEDFFSAAVYRMDAGSGLINDAGTTDFPFTIDRSMPIRDLNVRVNLTHSYVSDLQIQLIAPNSKVVTLFDRRGANGNDLRDTRFDDEATRSLDLAVAPFSGVFHPYGGLLSDMVGDDALGTWTLRVTDLWAGETGLLNSWGLTVTTDAASSGVTLTSITPINDLGNSVASRIRSLELEFSAPMNPATVTAGDVKVIGPGGLPVPIRSVVPAAGTNNTRFVVNTPLWVKAGAYAVKLSPAVADIYGNGLDTNGNGHFLEAADAVTSTHTMANHVFVSKGRPVAITLARPAIMPITVGNITTGELMVEVNLAHPNVGDLSIVLVTPHWDTYYLKWPSTVTGGANLIRTVFADAATDSLANGTAPYRGDFKPADGLIGQRNIPKMGTWRLKIEDKVSQAPASLLSWALYIKP
jgi:subtilisin-like proprotein convertase family protein